MQSVTPLQLARLEPGDHLLGGTCNYGFTERNHSADLKDRSIVAEDSVRFDLVEALLTTQEAATP